MMRRRRIGTPPIQWTDHPSIPSGEYEVFGRRIARVGIARKQFNHVRLGRAIRILPGVIEELLRRSRVDFRTGAFGTAERAAPVQDSQATEEGR